MFFNQPFRNKSSHSIRDISRFELYLLGEQPPFRNSIEGVASVGIVREMREDISANLALLFFLIYFHGILSFR